MGFEYGFNRANGQPQDSAVQTSSPIADRTDTANHALPHARPRLQPRPRFGGHVQRQEHRLRQLVRRPPSQAALPTRCLRLGRRERVVRQGQGLASDEGGG
eukprot:scaffold57094_cov46-Phaeocystis_antarctica.AAC.3